MSETPPHRRRHALSDGAPYVPEQGGAHPTAGSGPTADDVVDAEARTMALPVIPRQRANAPSNPVVDRLPEPFRPAPVYLVPADRPSAGNRALGLPELPESVRPVLPAVLGAVTALVLALGVVAGVNGSRDPAPAPTPPAVTGP